MNAAEPASNSVPIKHTRPKVQKFDNGFIIEDTHMGAAQGKVGSYFSSQYAWQKYMYSISDSRFEMCLCLPEAAVLCPIPMLFLCAWSFSWLTDRLCTQDRQGCQVNLHVRIVLCILLTDQIGLCGVENAMQKAKPGNKAGVS